MFVVFVGDNQIESLKRLFDLSAVSSPDQQTSYVDPRADVSETASEPIRRADTLVVQNSAPDQDLNLDELNPTAPRFYVPQVRADFLWPFGGQAHPRSPSAGAVAGWAFASDFGDVYLNRSLAAMPRDVEALAAAYEDIDLTSLVDLDVYLLQSLEQQERLDPQQRYGIGSLLLRHFRSEPLFASPSQPGTRVMRRLAQVLFHDLGVGARRLQEIDQFAAGAPAPPQLPIHPAVARHFGLTWVRDGHIYDFLWNQRLSFREYVRRYAACSLGTDLEVGLYLLQTGEIPQAIDKLRAGLSIVPRSASGRYALGVALARSGDAAGAVEELRVAIDIEPGDARLRGTLGGLLSDMGLRDEAERELRAAVALDPSLPAAHGDLGRFLSDKAALALHEAETELKAAIALRPADPDLQSALTVLYSRAGRLDEAIASATAESRLAPQNPHPFAFLGLLLGRRGNHAAAERALLQAISLDAGIASFHAEMGQVLRRLGRIREAEAAAQKALSLEPGNETYRSLLQSLKSERTSPLGESLAQLKRSVLDSLSKS